MPATQPAHPSLQIEILYGQGGVLTSDGMLGLAHKLSALDKRILCVTRNWNETQRVYNELAELPATTKIALIGYSLGAGSIVHIAEALKQRPVDLLIGYDPSIWQTPPLVPPNVKRAICYHNGGWDLFGHAKYKARELNNPRIEEVDVAEAHLLIDWDSRLHHLTFGAIKLLLPN